MNGLIAGLLIEWLRSIRRRSYTPEQIEEIKREAAAREGGPPRLEKKKRPYKWWRYEGLF